MPGETKIYVVWAEPAGQSADVKEADLEVNRFAGLDTTRFVAGVEQFAVLVDGAVKVGDVYKGSHAPRPNGTMGPGFNRFEACLRFTANNVTKYYGGGAGTFDNKEEVIKAFWALIWLEITATGDLMVVEIGKRF